jgi:hypothetical protein
MKGRTAMRWTTILPAFLAVAAAAGCQPAMVLPDGFVPVEEQPGLHQMRAVSADGVVLALRSHENPKRGTLAFWSEAIKNELVSAKGYKLVREEPVRSQVGRHGVLLTFTTEQKGTPFTYMTAVFVTGGQVLLAEAGGKADAVKPKLKAITKALLSAR